MFSKREREYYNTHRDRVCEALGITKNQYNQFRRMGQSLHGIYEENCNGYGDPQEERINELREKEISLKAVDLANELNLYLYFQTDPRGATIYLDTQEIPDNSYNNAHCVY